MTPRKKIGCYCIEVCKRDDLANNGLRCIGLPTELPGEKSNPAPPVDNDHVADGCEKFDV